MKKQSFINRTASVILAAAVLLSSCASTTLIQSTPSGARVYINDEPVGTTPYMHSDTKIVGSTSIVKLEKDGYQPVVTTITRDEKLDAGALIGGILVTIPFLWILEYKPVHKYELKPVAVNDQLSVITERQKDNTNKK